MNNIHLCSHKSRNSKSTIIFSWKKQGTNKFKMIKWQTYKQPIKLFKDFCPNCQYKKYINLHVFNVLLSARLFPVHFLCSQILHPIYALQNVHVILKTFCTCNLDPDSLLLHMGFQAIVNLQEAERDYLSPYITKIGRKASHSIYCIFSRAF